MGRGRRRRIPGSNRKAVETGNTFTVAAALKDQRKVKGKILVALGGEPLEVPMKIFGITQSRESQEQGFAFIAFDNDTFVTVRSDQILSVSSPANNR